MHTNEPLPLPSRHTKMSNLMIGFTSRGKPVYVRANTIIHLQYNGTQLQLSIFDGERIATWPVDQEGKNLETIVRQINES